MFQELWIPIAIISGLGLLFGLALALASKKFEVKQDERVTLIRDVLPGANCAACGFSGCDAYAENLVELGVSPNLCPVGGQETAKKISGILGVESEDMSPVVARVMCGGNNEVSQKKFFYEGIKDCSAASNLFGGPLACTYGCVGMGNCVEACMFDAIVIEKGIARVIQSKCTGCAKCVEACPKDLIDLVPSCSEYAVVCSSHDKGNIIRKNCSVGCIGCGRCVKACPVQAITLKDFLAKIDPEICTNCGECIKVCPTSSIKLNFCREIH